MANEHQNVTSLSRLTQLIKKFRDTAYRNSYARSHTKQFLAKQIRAFRGDESQEDFAKMIDVSQSQVSGRLENPNYGKHNLQTLFNVADELDVALFVRFVDHATYLTLTRDMSDSAVRPPSYDECDLSKLAKGESIIVQNGHIANPGTLVTPTFRIGDFGVPRSEKPPLKVA